MNDIAQLVDVQTQLHAVCPRFCPLVNLVQSRIPREIAAARRGSADRAALYQDVRAALQCYAKATGQTPPRVFWGGRAIPI